MNKRLILPFLLSLVLGFAGTSCKNDDKDGDAKTYSLTVSVVLPDGVTAADVAESITVTATHAQTQAAYTATASADNLTVTFNDLRSGSYTVKAVVPYTAKSQLTGTASVRVYNDASVSVKLNEVFASTLIFKEIYVMGYNYYMQDHYWEIVNNSDEVQYLDQVIIGSVEVNSDGPSVWVDENEEPLNLYPLMGWVLAFPGSGHDYPLQPGESVVLAQDAVNHKLLRQEGGFDDFDGLPDLSNAKFEAYLEASKRGDIDYPATNMTVIYDVNGAFWFGTGWFGQGVIMAKLPAGVNAQEWAADEANWMERPGAADTAPYLVIPSGYILDAVEIANPNTIASEGTVYKCILPQDDATYTWTEAWVGKCIKRKSYVENGRTRYQDTNNSADDFEVNQPLSY